MAETQSSYDYIVKKFGKDKISERSKWLYNLMSDYIDSRGLQGKVVISEDILEYVLVDYFVDIDRLKEFAEISKVNDTKIYAYTSYWVLKHKPLQIVSMQDAKDYVFANEEFIVYLLRGYLFSDPDGVPILSNKQEDVDFFVKTLLYYFKYRDSSAKSIEMILLAFRAGRGYQYSADYQK